jgi:hypothetical protein
LGLDREGGIEDFSMVQESEWDEIVELYQLYNLSGADKSRRPKYFYSRKDWDAHSEEQIYTGSWQASYHMSPEHFYKLLKILRPDLEVDEQ